MAKCTPNVAAARMQTERMLKEAERAIERMPSVHARPNLSGPKEFAPSKRLRSAEHCMPRLESARAAVAAAASASDPLEQRDGYIRAAFQAGQALSCARVTEIGKKLGHMPKPKKGKAPTDETA